MVEGAAVSDWKEALKWRERYTVGYGLSDAAWLISCVLLWEAHDNTGPAREYVERAGCIIRRERRRLEKEQGAEPKVVWQPDGPLLWFGLRYLAIAESQTTHPAFALRLSEQMLRQWWEEQG